MKDFTLEAYLNLLDTIKDHDLHIYGVKKWLEQGSARGVVMRHDVDRRPHNALDMAQAESERGISSTYYFRTVGSSFNPRIISSIYELGHEVGYHYEDLTIANGSLEKADQLFRKHLLQLRSIAPIETVAMHGSPLSKHNNLDFWKKSKLSDYDLMAEAFITINYEDSYYFTDTGRAWDSTRTNFRDRPKKSLPPPPNVKHTLDLINFIKAIKPQRLAFSIHPERWDKSALGWNYQLTRDLAFNFAKKAISITRGSK